MATALKKLGSALPPPAEQTCHTIDAQQIIHSDQALLTIDCSSILSHQGLVAFYIFVVAITGNRAHHAKASL